MQPANHYRLLGIAPFESDPDVIEAAADRQMAHVRTYQIGKHSAASQKILNEISTAKICLFNPQRRAAYDWRMVALVAPPVVLVLGLVIWAGSRGGPVPDAESVAQAIPDITTADAENTGRGVGNGAKGIGESVRDAAAATTKPEVPEITGQSPKLAVDAARNMTDDKPPVAASDAPPESLDVGRAAGPSELKDDVGRAAGPPEVAEDFSSIVPSGTSEQPDKVIGLRVAADSR